jgi:hypothetical protein
MNKPANLPSKIHLKTIAIIGIGIKFDIAAYHLAKRDSAVTSAFRVCPQT